MHKTCSKCKQTKNICEFHNRSSSNDGKQTFCKQCNIKSAQYSYKYKRTKKTKAAAKELKQRYLDALSVIKKRYACCACRESNPICLDFHHIKDNKKDNVSSWAYKKSKINLYHETNKCIVICSNCHRRLHANDLVLGSVRVVIITLEELTDLIVKK